MAVPPQLVSALPTEPFLPYSFSSLFPLPKISTSRLINHRDLSISSSLVPIFNSPPKKKIYLLEENKGLAHLQTTLHAYNGLGTGLNGGC